MSRDYTHDVLNVMLNAELILGNKPVSFHPFPRPTEPALCEWCCDAIVERGELCPECESERLVIDLTKRRHIKCGVQELALPSEKYYAIDDSSYDGVGAANVIGRGPSKREAIKDLLTKLAERGS